MPAWPEERKAYLREVCAAGEPKTAVEIGELIAIKFSLPAPLSKSTVISQAYRMRLKLPVAATPKKETAPPPAKSESSVLVRPRPTYRPDQRPIGPRANHMEDPGGPGVLLINAGSMDCRNPVSGEGLMMRVCGEPVSKIGDAWCSHCRPMLYTKASLRELEEV